jgi:hypothetical protein
MPETESIQEFTSSRGAKLGVDREKGVISGVKVLGSTSANKREYPAETVRRAMGMYEGRPVNVNHPSGSPISPRDYRDRIGVVRNVRENAGELWGDLHFNPKHQLAEQLAWDAENNPSAVGLSHNVLARTRAKNGVTIVEEIVNVHSVDLVADPATTKGLFEGRGENEMEMTLENVMANQAVMSQLTEHFKKAHESSEAAKAQSDKLAKLEEQLAEQKKKIDEYQVKEAQLLRAAKAADLLKEAKLPDVFVTDFLKEQLAAADDATAKKLIEERQQLAKAAKVTPQSISQHTEGKGGDAGGAMPTDVKSFVSRLRRAG